jgi:non-specific serine/threonine protein kinase
MAVAHIAAQLGDRFELLVSTSRIVPPRQRTLRATFDWSFAALGDDERGLFLALSVCEGGCSLDTAGRLALAAGIDAPVTDLLAGLVDKSLVVAPRAAGAEPRFDILETLRAYGRERLRETGALERAQGEHRTLFGELVAEAERGLLTGEYRAWHARLDRELGNIRAAYDSAMAGGDWEAALRLGGDLWWFWATSNRHAEGAAWTEAALVAAGDDLTPSARTRALTCLCFLAAQAADVDRAVAWGREAVALAAATGDEHEAAWAKQSLALTFEIAGQRERAAPLLAHARAVMTGPASTGGWRRTSSSAPWTPSRRATPTWSTSTATRSCGGRSRSATTRSAAGAI